MDSIILAGAIAPEEIRKRGVPRIPLLKIESKTILERTCMCLLEGGGCQRVFVLAPDEVELPDNPAILRADYSGDVISDLERCLKNRVKGEFCLVSSADMPLLTNDAVESLVVEGDRFKSDIVFPAVGRDLIEKRFPGTKRTYMRIGSSQVSGGNLFWVNREWLLARSDLLRRLFEVRKSVKSMAGIFGIAFLVRVMLGLAPLEYIERHLGGVLNGELKAVILKYPEIAVDLDKLADLELFEPYLDQFNTRAVAS